MSFAIGLIVALVAAEGCGSSSRPGRTPAAGVTSSQGLPVASPSVQGGPSPSPSPIVADQLVLRADLSSSPAHLPVVVRVSFGPRTDELGLLTDRRHTSIPIFPPSFAVASDGSFWFVDQLKHRLAHFAHDGAYMGQIAGIRFDRFHPQPQDLVAIGDALYLLEQDHQRWLLSSVAEFQHGGRVSQWELHETSRPVIVLTLISGTPDLIGLDGGLAGDPKRVGDGDQGPAALTAAPPPNVRIVDGVPVGARIRVAGRSDPVRPDDRYLLTLVGPEATSIEPIQFVLTPTGAEHARHLLAQMGFHLEAVLPDRFVAWVPLAPSRPGDAQRFGGGTWMLQFPVDGSPLVWTRLPEPGLSSEAQTRRFAAGPNGTLYYMDAQNDGMVIYQVPTS